jgi:hypothetical protein
MFTYRQPNYLVDVFSKALPADQKEFLSRMAKDNQDIFYNDGALAVSWKELTERALFWEKFIQKYPKVILLMMPNYYLMNIDTSFSLV